MPTGVADIIASVLGLFDGSRLVTEQTQDVAWPEDWLFGFGKLVVVHDGKAKLGIERRPLVFPLNDKKEM